MPLSTRRISAAGLIVLAAITGACADANPTGVAIPKQPAHSVSIAAATAWRASGPGTVTVVSDGTAGDAVMTYEYFFDAPSSHTWDFETTANQTATVTLPWTYSGVHETIDGGSTVVLYATVNGAVVATLIDVTGAAFSSSGTATFTVSAGDTYGFRLGGSSNDGSPSPNMRGTFTVDLPEAPVNTAPVLDSIANQHVEEGSTLHFTASATDADAGQTVTYSLVGAPAGASIDPATGVFSWTPVDDDPTGTGQDDYTFTVKATDSGSPAASDEQEVIVTVHNGDPVITAVTGPAGPIVLSGGSAVAHISVSFTDVGTADTHTTTIFCGNSTFASAAGDCTYTAAGVYTVTAVVNDDDNGGDVDTIQVVVAHADPVTKDECKNGGWKAFGFHNQGQCNVFVNTGHDSR